MTEDLDHSSNPLFGCGRVLQNSIASWVNFVTVRGHNRIDTVEWLGCLNLMYVRLREFSRLSRLPFNWTNNFPLPIYNPGWKMGCTWLSGRKIRYPHQSPLLWVVVHVGPDVHACLDPALGMRIEPKPAANNMFHVVLSSEHMACITTWSLAIAEDC